MNQFQLCRKGEIKQDKIEMQLQVQLELEDDETFDDEDDYDLLHRCLSLDVLLEIGESHDRDKFSWKEAHSLNKKKNSVFGQRVKECEFEFKMNHIKQIVKLEICGNFTPVNQSSDSLERRVIFTAFYNFGRCVLKNGALCMPTTVSQQLHKGVQAKVGISEKLKNGGYRCITLKAFDCKGGDFVESDYTMVVADFADQVIVEIGPEIPLSHGPQGFFKLIEIGVNNYDPHLFMKQKFTIYFFRKD